MRASVGPMKGDCYDQGRLVWVDCISFPYAKKKTQGLPRVIVIIRKEHLSVIDALRVKVKAWSISSVSVKKTHGADGISQIFEDVHDMIAVDVPIVEDFED